MPEPALHTDIAAALDWWRMAGVDHDYGEVKGWLREAEAPAPAPAATADAPAQRAAPPSKPRAEPAAPPPPALGGPAEQWPADLALFRDWWLAEPTLGPATERVPSRGAAGAALLVLVPQPEAEDAAAGHLLAGEQGRLVSALLRAMGLADNAALAALLPRHTPFADWDALSRAGLGALARHHLALHRPARVLALGTGILPLLGLDPAQSPALLPLSGQEDPPVPVLGAPSLEVLLARPAARAALWRNWLEWTTA